MNRVSEALRAALAQQYEHDELMAELWRIVEAKGKLDNPTAGMTFGQAIAALKAGQNVTRPRWNGKGMWLGLQRPTQHSKMTLPYIFMQTASDDLVPWLASQSDMLAEDWMVVDIDDMLASY